MKALLTRFFAAEHYIAHSVFLLGLFGTAVDYLHVTPLPADWAHYTVFIGGVLKAADYTRSQWQKAQTP